MTPAPSPSTTSNNLGIDCEGMGGLEECYRPGDTVNATGQFICRRRFNFATGSVSPQTLCIARTWGRASDRCGCCEMGACPTGCTEVCRNPDGMQGPPYGVFVYNWASPTPDRMCTTVGRTLQLQQQNRDVWRCTGNDNPAWFPQPPRRTGFGQ